MENKELTKQEKIDKVSQEIFGKDAKDIKYLYVTNFIHQSLLDEDLTRTGLYQWINVFNGDIKKPEDVEDFNDYDIIQVNLSTQDTYLIPLIRSKIRKDSKTKLIVNNDYTTEQWGNAFGHPLELANSIKQADMIFGTEYYQVTALSELTHRRVFVIPHPADIKRLKSLKKIQTEPIISTIWRRYDKNAYVPSLAVRNHGLKTQLIGFDKNIEPKAWLVTTLFDKAIQGTNFFDFCDQLRQSKIVYDPFTYHSYNRSIVDCAAMGVPVVGSDRTQSIKICYPFTKVDPYDVTKARQLINQLNNDEEFRKKVIDYAKTAAEYYNHENSRQRYLEALLDALKNDTHYVLVDKENVVESVSDALEETKENESENK